MDDVNHFLVNYDITILLQNPIILGLKESARIPYPVSKNLAMFSQGFQLLSNKILTVLNSDTGRKEMIEGVIGLIQKETEFSAVGMRLKDGDAFPYFAQSGFPRNFIALENSLVTKPNHWIDCKEDNCSQLLECTCGLVISGKAKADCQDITEFGSFWTNNSKDILNIPADQDPRLHPRNTCAHVGYGSIAIIPIRAHGKIISTLQINDRHTNAFTLKIIRFFEDTSLAIGSAIMRKQSEEISEKDKKHLKEIQKIAHIGSYTFNIPGNVWTSGEILDNIFGIPSDYKKTFESWLEIIHPDFRTIMEEYFQFYVIDGGNQFNKEYKIIRKNDNQERWVIGFGNLKYDGKNKPIEMVGTIMDITEKKVAEIERDMVIDQLINRNKDLEQFSYIVSHNLRSPLANLLGLTELLTDGELEYSESIEVVKNISNSVQKLDTMIKDLNYILQIKNEAIETKSVVEFENIVADVKSSIENLVKKENVTFVTNFSCAPEFFTSKSFIYSIFYNLISNSIKYRKPDVDPVIEISSKRNENKIVLVFQDNGLGIDLNAHAKNVFGLYKRFHGHIEGKGMGLYMVKTQVESLGGTIDVNSQINNGTTFYLAFKC